MDLEISACVFLLVSSVLGKTHTDVSHTVTMLPYVNEKLGEHIASVLQLFLVLVQRRKALPPQKGAAKGPILFLF